MTRPLQGEGVPLVPKGNPDEIEVIAVYEGRTSSSGPRTAFSVRMKGLWAVFALGIAAGYALAWLIS